MWRLHLYGEGSLAGAVTFHRGTLSTCIAGKEALLEMPHLLHPPKRRPPLVGKPEGKGACWYRPHGAAFQGTEQGQGGDVVQRIWRGMRKAMHWILFFELLLGWHCRIHSTQITHGRGQGGRAVPRSWGWPGGIWLSKRGTESVVPTPIAPASLGSFLEILRPYPGLPELGTLVEGPSHLCFISPPGDVSACSRWRTTAGCPAMLDGQQMMTVCRDGLWELAWKCQAGVCGVYQPTVFALPGLAVPPFLGGFLGCQRNGIMHYS